MGVTYGPPSALTALLAAADMGLSQWPAPPRVYVALDPQIGTALMPNPTVIPATLNLTGAPPINVPGGQAGQVLTSDASGNLTLQAAGGNPSGLAGHRYLTGGGTLTAGMIATDQAAGYTGWYLDPRYVWDMSGVVINGVQNFVIESRMRGSIGWLGNIAYNTSGYIKTSTGSPADGIQVYSSAPNSAQTQGVIFKNCVIVGAHPNGVIHFGGGQRRCGLVDSLVYNTMSASTPFAGTTGTNVNTFTGTQSLSVTSSASFPTAGTVFVATSTGVAQITYSGTGTGVLNNCSTVSGSGTLTNGVTVALATFGVIQDVALSSPNNSEDMIFSFTGGGGIAGAYAALGLGIGNATGAVNDTSYYDLATAGGSYSIVKFSGGNHSFYNWYDRSNPSIVNVWNHGGGRMVFHGAEDQNTTGLSHLIDANATTVLMNRMVTQAGATNTCQVSAGSLILRGACVANQAQTWLLSGTGTIDLSDPAINAGSATVSGSSASAMLMLANSYPGAGSPPILTSWTGPLGYQLPAVVASGRGTGVTTAQTVSWTPPAVGGTRFRVSVYISVGTAGTSTVPVLAYHGIGSTTPSYTVPMWFLNSAATAPSYLCAANGEYFGTVTADTDGTATAITLTITPTGSTFRFSAVIERLT